MEWDPYTFAILTEVTGTIQFKDLLEGVTMHEELDEVTRDYLIAVRDADPGLKRHGHMGIYGYSRKVLLDFVKWKPTPLEKTEKLEQLRALEHGVRIKVLKATRPSLGIDTPEDAAKFEAMLASKKR